MEDLKLTVAVFLAIAFFLGLLFLLIWMKMRKDDSADDEVLSESELERRLSELEGLYEVEKALASEYEQKNRELKGQLIKKTHLLESTSERLKEIQGKAPTVDSEEVIKDLKNQLTIKNRELIELEEVLYKAEYGEKTVV